MNNRFNVRRGIEEENLEEERGIIPFSQGHARSQLHEGCRDQGGVLPSIPVTQNIHLRKCVSSRDSRDNRPITRDAVVR